MTRELLAESQRWAPSATYVGYTRVAQIDEVSTAYLGQFLKSRTHGREAAFAMASLAKERSGENIADVVPVTCAEVADARVRRAVDRNHGRRRIGEVRRPEQSPVAAERDDEVPRILFGQRLRSIAKYGPRPELPQRDLRAL